MKKVVSLLLTLAMLLGIGSMVSVFAADGGIKVGYARFDFTPDSPVPLGGLTARDSEGVLDPVYGTVVAIAGSDGSTALICTTDLVRTETAWMPPLREAMSNASGVPENNIHISATHTHSSMDTASGTACGIDTPFYNTYVDGFAKAAKEAVADLSPVTTKIGSVDIPHLSQVRHNWRGNGHVNGANFESSGAGRWFKEATHQADPELQIIRFVREGKKDVLMLNWQCHAITASCTTDYGKSHKQYISADFIGYCRNYLEAQDGDCLVAYYSGASGNVSPFHLVKARRDLENCPEESNLHGERLAGYILPALKNLKTIEVSGPVKGVQMIAPLLDKGISDIVKKFEINAIGIGKSIGFATFAGEMFFQNGQYIKENSPFEITFVLTQANGTNLYVPEFSAYDYPELFAGNPTVYEVSVSRYAKGSAEDMAFSLVSMLNTLYK